MRHRYQAKCRGRIEMKPARLLPAIAALTMLAVPTVQAQGTFPDRPIRLIIGSAPGSGPDIIARAMADRLFKSWGQRIVVDSRPGAAGTISAEIALRSAADGYTWMILTSQLLIASEVFANLKFNLQRDFASVALVGTVPFILLVNPQVPAKSVAELIELAKKAPGSLRYGSAGTGGGEHLTGVYFTHAAGIKMLHVPYKGIAQAVIDTIARELHMSFAVFPVAAPHVLSGRLRGLGITTKERSPLLPDIAPIAATIPGFDTYGWYSVVAPTGVSVEILDKVSAEVVKVVNEPEFGEQLKGLGINLSPANRAALDNFRNNETKRIVELVKAAGVKLQ
jgi:tripartite-type tricarboxylate transporter receptor subunit TctC